MADAIKYPKLIKKTPKVQLDKLPKLPATKCGKRTKVCSVRRQGCAYRYKKGDKSWICPSCGTDRRCMTDKIKDLKTCRMHGGKGGRPKEPKYVISASISKAFDRIIASPDILNLKDEIAMLTARTNQLNHYLDEFTVSHSWGDMKKSIEQAQKALAFGRQDDARKALAYLAASIEPLRAQYNIWGEIRENGKIIESMMDKQHKWNMQNEQMVATEDVFSFLARMTMMAIKYIVSPQDRKAFIKEARQYAPETRGNGKHDR